MSRVEVTSWGRVKHEPSEVLEFDARHAPLPQPAGSTTSLLTRGNGRSYGDVGLNPGGTLLDTRRLDRFISFDPATGVLGCESGVLLSEILRLVVPRGWFVPVTPGTRFVTVGGAIANDVHGKNHHTAGTFGCHVRSFELLRSDGQRLQCMPDRHPGLFAATIGGLGLTGLITRAEIQLKRIANAWMDVETLRYRSLEEFFALASASERDHEYTVAWVDCSARGKHTGRGLFMRANHAPAGATTGRYREGNLSMPFAPPFSLVNGATLRLLNTLYYRRQWRDVKRELAHYEPYFYPLDGVRDWNRLYGRRGFYQYQCVLPEAAGIEGTRALLAAIGASGLGSFLAVLKTCGAVESPGLLSFPMAGTTLAIDFPNVGARLFKLFDRLNSIVLDAGGRLNPSKDGLMPPELFRRGFPRLAEFSPYIDPRFSSGFWRRVTEAS
jgi:FAD/FMN-containing dehydrogenase